MANQTMLRFGYPDTLIHEFEHWTVLLRGDQVTLGSLVLCAKAEATTFSDLPAPAFTQLGLAVGGIETALKAAFQYDRINYLMLMMVDPNVHFHVFPRYESERSGCGLTIADAGWPGPPKLAEALSLDSGQSVALREHIKGFWPPGES